ncbi:MAG: hypothetical protein K8R39_06850 [Arcobacteraceae bacterium]|nr:hypothetical protein [Arcobacteraceae bacterium]
MAVDNVVTNSATGVDGNAYTTQVSNDQLTSEDFLKLMLEEMKMQDPTKPMDSAALMDSQLKMSTIESNMAMSESLNALQQSYAASALSTAANMIGHIIEDGSTNDSGEIKSYAVETVENKDGELYVNARELTGFVDALVNTETEKLTLYDAEGYIYEDGEKLESEYRISLDPDGRFRFNEDGSLKIVDKDNNVITLPEETPEEETDKQKADREIIERYKYYNSSPVYAEETTVLPLSAITLVH